MTMDINERKEIRNGAAKREISDEALESVTGGYDHTYYTEKLSEID